MNVRGILRERQPTRATLPFGDFRVGERHTRAWNATGLFCLIDGASDEIRHLERGGRVRPRSPLPLLTVIRAPIRYAPLWWSAKR